MSILQPVARPLPSGEVTRLLHAHREGQAEALDQLLPLVLDALRAAASRQLRGERADHTLNTTALVHEAYLKLLGYDGLEYESLAHFFGVAARAMRQILVSYARKRNAEKRGGGVAHIALDDATPQAVSVEWIADVDEALSRLGELSPRAARVVECRYFGGLTVEETAEALGISPATVARDWRTARAWLRHELGA